jgi:hypothetical protein
MQQWNDDAQSLTKAEGELLEMYLDHFSSTDLHEFLNMMLKHREEKKDTARALAQRKLLVIDHDYMMIVGARITERGIHAGLQWIKAHRMVNEDNVVELRLRTATAG